MEFDKADIYPEYCLSFSPNWYAHQILSINDEGIACYGSNDEVYLIDIEAKKIITSVTMRSLEVQRIKESSKKKVSSVLLTEDYIIFTNCKGYLTIFEKQDNTYEMVYLELLELKKDIAYIRLIDSEEPGLHFLMNDIEYLSIYCSFQEGQLNKKFIRRKGKPSRVKYFQVITYQGFQFVVLANEDGVIQIWDTKLKEQILHVDIKNRINCVDMLYLGDIILIGVYTKKGQLQVSLINLKTLFDDMLAMEKNQDSYREVKTFKVSFEREEASKEAKFVLMSILWLDKNAILLSGKTGEVYQINLPLVQTNQIITLKPFSTDEFGTQPYELLEDNPHYKSIYFFKRFDDRVISIGVDRMVTFWDYNDDTVLQNFTINCLGGKITQIIKNPLEKEYAVMVGYDNTLRVWNIAKDKNRFSTLTIWKKLSGKSIIMGTCHPTDEGIMAFFTSKDDICLYHLFTHTMFKSFTKEKLNLVFMRWVPKQLFSLIYNLQFQATVLGQTEPDISDKFECLFFNYKKTYKRKLNNDHLLMLFSKTYGLLFVDSCNESIIQLSLKGFSHDISCMDMWMGDDLQNPQCLMAFGHYSGDLTFVYTSKDGTSKKDFLGNHSGVISTLNLSIMDSKKLMKCATGSYDRYIHLFRIEDPSSPDFNVQEGITLYSKLKHKFRIMGLDFSTINPDYMLNICEKHATVQVWNCAFGEIADRRIWNIRGHRGFLSSAAFSCHSENMVITSSEDQTVKVWDLLKIKNRIPPNKKRAKKRKDSDDDEDDEAEDEVAGGRVLGKRGAKNKINIADFVEI